jgi:hypothetical protein
MKINESNNGIIVNQIADCLCVFSKSLINAILVACAGVSK